MRDSCRLLLPPKIVKDSRKVLVPRAALSVRGYTRRPYRITKRPQHAQVEMELVAMLFGELVHYGDERLPLRPLGLWATATTPSRQRQR